MSPGESSYREYEPCGQLRPFVECYWTSTTTAKSPQAHRILPDGCVDFIFDPNLSEYANGVVVGTMSTAQMFEPNGRVQMVAVRFRPGGAWPFLKTPMVHLTNTHVPLEEFMPASTWASRIHETNGEKDKIQQLESQLLSSLPSASSPNRVVREAISQMRSGDNVEGTAARLDISRQHLNRLFRQHVGIGPKVLARISRLQQMVTSIDSLTGTEWGMLADQLGFFDQAHMITDCRQLTGLTPVQLRESRQP